MISHKFKFIYVPIIKTGTTSIVRHLRTLDNETIVYKTKHWCISDFLDMYPDNHDYFRFSFVRNPWDRMVSLYFYLDKQIDLNATFEEYIKKLNNKNWLFDTNSSVEKLNIDRQNGLREGTPAELPQFGWLINTKDTENQCMNFIGKFENLQEDFDTICDKIGIPKQQLPHKNATKHKHYTEYYDDETRSIVAEKYAKDIEYFGYKFGD